MKAGNARFVYILVPIFLSSPLLTKVCIMLSPQVSFEIDESVEGPIYLYYEMKNYFQNHRRYYQSRSILQLQGQVTRLFMLL